MSDFSIREAAFSGFALARRQPMTVLTWFIFSLVVNGAATGLMLTFVMPKMTAMPTGPQADPTAVLGAMGAVFGVIALLIPVYILISAVTTSAANRAILRPAESRFGYLRLGGDELRMAATIIVLGLALSAVYFVMALVLGLLVGVAGFAAGTSQSTGGAVGAVVGMILMVFIIVGVMLFLCVRFALAPAMTLDKHRIDPFGSWSVTKGHAGKIFLTYLVVVLIYFGLYLVALAVMGALSMSLGLGFLGALNAVNPSAAGPTAAALSVPALIINGVISGFVAAVGMALMLCPGASIYKQITGKGLADVF